MTLTSHRLLTADRRHPREPHVHPRVGALRSGEGGGRGVGIDHLLLHGRPKRNARYAVNMMSPKTPPGYGFGLVSGTVGSLWGGGFQSGAGALSSFQWLVSLPLSHRWNRWVWRWFVGGEGYPFNQFLPRTTLLQNRMVQRCDNSTDINTYKQHMPYGCRNVIFLTKTSRRLVITHQMFLYRTMNISIFFCVSWDICTFYPSIFFLNCSTQSFIMAIEIQMKAMFLETQINKIIVTKINERVYSHIYIYYLSWNLFLNRSIAMNIFCL